MSRAGRFLRRGDARSSAVIAGIVVVWVGVALLENRADAGRPATAALLVVGVLLVFGVAWLVTAKLASDLSAVHAQNAALEARQRALAARYAADAAAFECSEEEFAAIAEQELEVLPGWIAAAIREHNVGITVEDEHRGDPRVLGLYREASGTSEIILYRRSIIRAAGRRSELHRVVHDTLLHELGHLFGMSERDLDRWSIGNDPMPGAQPVHPPREWRPPDAG